MHLLDDNGDGIIQFSEFLRNIDQLYATLKRKDYLYTDAERDRRAEPKRERKDFNFSEINTIIEMYKRSKKKISSDGKGSPGRDKTEIFNRDDDASKLISITNLVNTNDPPGPTPMVSPCLPSGPIPDTPTGSKPHLLYCDKNLKASPKQRSTDEPTGPGQPFGKNPDKLPQLHKNWAAKPLKPDRKNPNSTNQLRGKIFDCLESNFYEGYLKVKP
jgi:hypothetical protein